MRKKILVLFAVPALFLMSLVLLMSDIRHISTANDNPQIVTRAEVGSNRRFREPDAGRGGSESDVALQKDKNPSSNKLGDIKQKAKDKLAEKGEQAKENLAKLNEQLAQDRGEDHEDEEMEHKKAMEQAKHHGAKGASLRDNHDPESRQRAEAVRNAYLHAWKSYEKYVWGQDELKPISKTAHNWVQMGLSIVDSIDTMWLMGLKDEYKKARDWIEKNLNFDRAGEISFFETTIRVVGGLVSMYDLTQDRMYIEKAEKLAKKMMPAFNTNTGIPYCSINIQNGHAANPSWTGGASVLSEVGTVQVEYASLSERTGHKEYAEKSLKVFDVLDRAQKINGGLYPVYVNPADGRFHGSQITLGALGDSFYEYLLKLYLVMDKKEDKYKRMYNEATDAIITHLVKYSDPSRFAYIAEHNGAPIDKMDHLVCFAGAMFALGAYHNVTPRAQEHMTLGKEITRTCHETYKQQATGLGPEIVRFGAGRDFYIDHSAKHYILRPETVESYYVLYWITRDPIYQQWGWEAFQAIEKHCRMADGYTGIRDVTTTSHDRDDLQQSFFMAETLKYLYLLFAPIETLSLDEYVFNTEAHPIKIWGR